jgi:hypothetical protein
LIASEYLSQDLPRESPPRPNAPSVLKLRSPGELRWEASIPVKPRPWLASQCQCIVAAKRVRDRRVGWIYTPGLDPLVDTLRAHQRERQQVAIA